MDLLKEKIGECESVYLYEADADVKRQLVLYCDHIGRDIYLTQDVEELLTMGFDISHTFDTPFIRTKRKPEEWYYGFVKHMIEVRYFINKSDLQKVIKSLKFISSEA